MPFLFMSNAFLKRSLTLDTDLEFRSVLITLLFITCGSFNQNLISFRNKNKTFKSSSNILDEKSSN